MTGIKALVIPRTQEHSHSHTQIVKFSNTTNSRKLFPDFDKKLRQEISHQGGSQVYFRKGKEKMELGHTFTQNYNDHLTEDTVARDPQARWWMGCLSLV